jgi:hypothetical protein
MRYKKWGKTKQLIREVTSAQDEHARREIVDGLAGCWPARSFTDMSAGTAGSSTTGCGDIAHRGHKGHDIYGLASGKR